MGAGDLIGWRQESSSPAKGLALVRRTPPSVIGATGPTRGIGPTGCCCAATNESLLSGSSGWPTYAQVSGLPAPPAESEAFNYAQSASSINLPARRREGDACDFDAALANGDAGCYDGGDTRCRRWTY